MSIKSTISTAGTERTDRGSALRSAAPILFPVLAIALSACTATRSGQTITAPQSIETSKAMILPAPGGPMVIGVIEERFSDAVEQKVILGTDATNSGQNYMSIRLFGPMERETRGTKSIGYRSVTSVSMHNEAVRAMPGMPMKSSALFLRNNYGPFGYSFGQNRAGDSCIYGWQQLRSSESQRGNFRNVGAIQIRLRLCENGASERQLLSVMYGYTVNGSFSSEQWNPFGRARTVPAMNVSGEPIYPNDGELAEPAKVVTVAPARRRPVVVRTAPVEEQTADDTIEEENAAKRIVDVPSPTDAGSDTAPADTDTGTSPDTTPDASVTVPGPG